MKIKDNALTETLCAALGAEADRLPDCKQHESLSEPSQNRCKQHSRHRGAAYLGHGDPTTFLTRPINATLLVLTVIKLMLSERKKWAYLSVEGD